MTDAELAAWEQSMRETGWPEARPAPRHGTFGLATNYSCHCPECTEASREYHRAYRARYRA